MSDGISWTGAVPDYKSDAEALIKKLEKEKDTEDEVPVPKADKKLEMGEKEA